MKQNLNIILGVSVLIDSNGNVNIEVNGEVNNVKSEIKIHCGGNTTIESDGDTIVNANGNVSVDGKNVILGSNATKKLVNNLPICPVTRGPHCIGNTNVYV